MSLTRLQTAVRANSGASAKELSLTILSNFINQFSCGLWLCVAARKAALLTFPPACLCLAGELFGEPGRRFVPARLGTEADTIKTEPIQAFVAPRYLASGGDGAAP